MKIPFILLAALFAAAGPATAQDAKPETKGRLGCIYAAAGKVELRQAGKTDWLLSPKGRAIAQGDAIRTAGGAWCEILLKEGSFIKLEENSEMTAETLVAAAERREFSFSFLKGKALWMAMKLGNKINSAFSVRTPSAVCAVRGTAFSLLVSTSGETAVGLFEGAVALTGDAGEKTLLPGQEAAAGIGKLETKDRLSGLMLAEERRYRRIKKRVEDLRARLAAREDFIDDFVNRRQKAVADLEKRQQEKLKKR
ncbi:MAG: FecR domain-containing protein [Elusimicrobiales bacterium]|nr:FecR domain-containing protein [Elusimicrobiales bacterium]